MLSSVLNIFQHSEKRKNSTIFIVALIFGKILEPSVGSILFIWAVIYIASNYINLNYQLLNFAISAVFFVGLSPLFLIARGFVTNSSLNDWDLQIYGLIFAFAFYISNLLNKNKSILHSDKNLRSHQSNLIAGLASLFIALFVEFILRQRSLGDAVAWIGSGDSKNHLVNGAQIAQYGFLDPTTFYIQPVSAPSMLSLVLSQGGLNLGSSTELLKYQMLTYSYIWILLIGILGLSFAALTDLTWKNLRSNSEETPALILVLASITPTFSFVLGSALFDGFFTALFGISALVVLVGWVFAAVEENQYSPRLIILGFLLFSCAIMGWMFVLPFALLVTVFGLRENIQKTAINKIKIDSSIIIVALVVALSVHFSSFGQEFIKRIKTVLSTEGVANVSNPNVYISLILIMILISLTLPNIQFRRAMFSISLLQIIAIALFKYFSHLGLFKWNYYLLKYQWIMFSVMSAIFVAVFMSKIFSSIEKKFYTRFTAAALIFISVFFYSESLVNSNSNKVWQKIWRGWDNPRAKTMNAVFNQNIDFKNPTMFFHFGYAGESMMANFWLNAFADPIDPIKGWNYTIDTTGDVKQLCDVNAYYPTVTVVTSDTMLEQSLIESCKNEKFNIELETPLYE